MARYFRSYRYFQEQHPCLVGALYWLAGMIAKEHPWWSLSFLCSLHLFLPNKPSRLFFFGLCWFLPLFLLSPSPIHLGTARGEITISGPKPPYYGEIHTLYQDGVHRELKGKVLFEKEITPGHYQFEGKVISLCPVTIQASRLTPTRHYNWNDATRQLAKRYFSWCFSDPLCRDFASSLVLGTPLPNSLKTSFQKKGLAHLFAVSGWHFSLFFMLFSWLFGALSLVPRILSLIGSITLLVFFFPMSPSVWRTWISLSLLTISPLCIGNSSSLNRLGISCILCSCVFSPLSPAFTLSFLATLGIVLFFQPLQRELMAPWETLFSHPIILAPIRYLSAALALSIASQSFLLLPILTWFDSFPLDGILFNLFFPPLIIVVFFSILLTLLIPPLAYVAEAIISFLLTHSGLDIPPILTTLEGPMGNPILLIPIFLLGVALRKPKS